MSCDVGLDVNGARAQSFAPAACLAGSIVSALHRSFCLSAYGCSFEELKARGSGERCMGGP